MFKIKNTTKITSAVLLIASSFFSQATVVEVQTSLGNIQINLFDEATPKTVENFLQYVNSGAYVNNVVHRSVDGFVVQSGGFTYTGAIKATNGFSLDNVPTGTAVQNEPKLSNLRGTIAMAKLGSDANSATSQWFFNLANNSSNLDVQNGGFTVFGQVIGDGMQIVDDIAAQTQISFGGAFTNVPIRNYTQADADASADITDNNLVIISDIVVTDPAVVTNPDLTPAANTLINPTSGGSNGGGSSDSGSGGGSFAWLLLLAGAGLFRRFVK
ncbi:peptidylprolyl isomerase [Paraglaciecola sp.]|uniref:peptidylprolyl isomerase n=1 Tax=Paraglaciecola sp. TaxID=1920173 RepID=UPI003EF74D88